MEQKLKIVVILTVIILVIQLFFVWLLVKSYGPKVISSPVGQVSAMNREERIKLLETLWQAPDFKMADMATRRKAFESIVIK